MARIKKRLKTANKNVSSRNFSTFCLVPNAVGAKAKKKEREKELCSILIQLCNQYR